MLRFNSEEDFNRYLSQHIQSLKLLTTTSIFIDKHFNHMFYIKGYPDKILNHSFEEITFFNRSNHIIISDRFLKFSIQKQIIGREDLSKDTKNKISSDLL